MIHLWGLCEMSAFSFSFAGFNLVYVLEGAKLIIVVTWVEGAHLAGQERDW